MRSELVLAAIIGGGRSATKKAVVSPVSSARSAGHRINVPGDQQRELMPSRDHLESFISNCFRSVWALEILRFLAEHPADLFTPDELITAMRASDAVVSQGVDNLVAMGLAVVDSDSRCAFYQGSEEQAKLVQSAIEFYRKSPNKVRRLIVAQSMPGVTAFADAFKFRRD